VDGVQELEAICESVGTGKLSANDVMEMKGKKRRTVEIDSGILETVREKSLAVDGKHASPGKVADDVDADRVEQGSPLPELRHGGLPRRFLMLATVEREGEAN
jgi:hypothetical protein